MKVNALKDNTESLFAFLLCFSLPLLLHFRLFAQLQCFAGCVRFLFRTAKCAFFSEYAHNDHFEL